MSFPFTGCGSAARVAGNAEGAETGGLIHLGVRYIGLSDGQHPRQGQLVELRFFGGLTVEETAAVLGVAPITVKRDWALARAWLFREMRGQPT